MKRRFTAILLSAIFAVTAVLGNAATGKAETVGGDNVLKLSNVTYTTVTEGFDWGPAITKVILNVGTTVDSSTLSKSTFQVSSERKYSAMDMTTMKLADKDEIAERTVVNAYISDAAGNEKSGNYITIEMEVGPTIVAGSPFNYDLTVAQNKYVETSYIVKFADGAQLKTTGGKILAMDATNALGNKGNVNVIADQFDVSGSYTANDGITLKYATYTPDKASKKKNSNPLIIWLHGAGEGGENPMIALLGNKVTNLATDKVQRYFGKTGAYVLAPQCQTMWMDGDGKFNYSKDGKSYYTNALMSLIKSYVKKHPEIDTNRIYIGGCSNGGYMTMNMMVTYPEYFAAAYPICECYSNDWLTKEKLNKIKNKPIWFTHAKDDPIVAIYEGTMDPATFSYTLKLDADGKEIPMNNFSNAAYNRLKEAGSKNVYYSLWNNVVDTSGKYFKPGSTTEPYQYMGHYSWIYALNNENSKKIDGKNVTMFEWLSKQSK